MLSHKAWLRNRKDWFIHKTKFQISKLGHSPLYPFLQLQLGFFVEQEEEKILSTKQLLHTVQEN